MRSRIQQLQANAQPRRDQRTREFDEFCRELDDSEYYCRKLITRIREQHGTAHTEATNTAPLRSFMKTRIPENLKHTLHAQMIRLTQWLIDREFDDVSITHHTGLLDNNTGQEPAQTPEQERMAQVRSHQRNSQEYKQQEYERKQYERRRNTNR